MFTQTKISFCRYTRRTLDEVVTVVVSVHSDKRIFVVIVERGEGGGLGYC